MYERWLDKASHPDEAALTAYCGVAGPIFAAFNDYLTQKHGTSREIRFPYGKSYGWCVTHRRGKKLVCDAFAEAGAFTVMARLSDAAFAKRYDELRPYARRIVDERYPCGTGGWIHFRVENAEQLEDIEKLLDAKCT